MQRAAISKTFLFTFRMECLRVIRELAYIFENSCGRGARARKAMGKNARNAIAVHNCKHFPLAVLWERLG